VGIKNEILNMKVSLEIFLSTAAAYNLDFRSVGLGVMYTPNSKRKNLNIPFHLNRLQYSYVKLQVGIICRCKWVSSTSSGVPFRLPGLL
jgi:hypothetical protein